MHLCVCAQGHDRRIGSSSSCGYSLLVQVLFKTTTKRAIRELIGTRPSSTIHKNLCLVIWASDFLLTSSSMSCVLMLFMMICAQRTTSSCYYTYIYNTHTHTPQRSVPHLQGLLLPLEVPFHLFKQGPQLIALRVRRHCLLEIANVASFYFQRRRDFNKDIHRRRSCGGSQRIRGRHFGKPAQKMGEREGNHTIAAAWVTYTHGNVDRSHSRPFPHRLPWRCPCCCYLLLPVALTDVCVKNGPDAFRTFNHPTALQELKVQHCVMRDSSFRAREGVHDLSDSRQQDKRKKSSQAKKRLASPLVEYKLHSTSYRLLDRQRVQTKAKKQNEKKKTIKRANAALSALHHSFAPSSPFLDCCVVGHTRHMMCSLSPSRFSEETTRGRTLRKKIFHLYV